MLYNVSFAHFHFFLTHTWHSKWSKSNFRDIHSGVTISGYQIVKKVLFFFKYEVQEWLLKRLRLIRQNLSFVCHMTALPPTPSPPPPPPPPPTPRLISRFKRFEVSGSAVVSYLTDLWKNKSCLISRYGAFTYLCFQNKLPLHITSSTCWRQGVWYLSIYQSFWVCSKTRLWTKWPCYKLHRIWDLNCHCCYRLKKTLNN